MAYWSWWLGGLALASVALAHWLALGRQMAISGRFTSLVNRWRFGPADESAAQATNDQLVRALQAMTAAEFGSDTLAEPASIPPAEVAPSDSKPLLRKRQGPAVHVTFLVCLALGGLLSALLAGKASFSLTLQSEQFASIFGGGFGAPAALLVGGILVGFGTRMAAGCTSGHGLCGVSRFQKGSLLATACFFGAGIVVSFALGALL